MNTEKLIQQAVKLYKEAVTNKSVERVTMKDCYLLSDVEKRLSYDIEEVLELRMDILSSEECVGALYVACIGRAVGKEVLFKQKNINSVCDKLNNENGKFSILYVWFGEIEENLASDIGEFHHILYNC